MELTIDNLKKVIENNSVFLNRTYTYLGRAVFLYPMFVGDLIHKTEPLGACIAATVYDKIDEPSICYIIENSKENLQHAGELDKHGYLKDLIPLDSFLNADYLLMVIDLSKYRSIYNNFTQSKYSKMFTEEQFEIVYNKEKTLFNIASHKVLTKSPMQEKHLTTYYGYNGNVEDIIEYDSPLDIREEFLNLHDYE